MTDKSKMEGSEKSRQSLLDDISDTSNEYMKFHPQQPDILFYYYPVNAFLGIMENSNICCLLQQNS